MKCPNPNCNKEVSPEWNVCPHCGYKPIKCSNPKCNSGWLPPEAKFCPVCGAKTNAEEEMRRRKAEEARKKAEAEQQKEKEQIATSPETVSSSSKDGCGFTLVSFFLGCILLVAGWSFMDYESTFDIGTYCFYAGVFLGVIFIIRVIKFMAS